MYYISLVSELLNHIEKTIKNGNRKLNNRTRNKEKPSKQSMFGIVFLRCLLKVSTSTETARR